MKILIIVILIIRNANAKCLCSDQDALLCMNEIDINWECIRNITTVEKLNWESVYCPSNFWVSCKHPFSVCISF